MTSPRSSPGSCTISKDNQSTQLQFSQPSLSLSSQLTSSYFHIFQISNIQHLFWVGARFMNVFLSTGAGHNPCSDTSSKLTKYLLRFACIWPSFLVFYLWSLHFWSLRWFLRLKVLNHLVLFLLQLGCISILYPCLKSAFHKCYATFP